MSRETSIGAAALLAIAAWVGFSAQGSKPAQSGLAGNDRSKPPLVKPKTPKDGPGCGSLRDELQSFLEIEELVLPKNCYPQGQDVQPVARPELVAKTSELKFVIATLPDPIHTHLPVLFDQFTVAIQEGAQDEKYDFDSAWLPWDTDEKTYTRLDDEKSSNEETEQKEEQPGIILFRKSNQPVTDSYCKGLVVFVVGEEATQGIHKAQFRNALAWIKALQPAAKPNGKQVAILGPTFSGSLPSLSQLLSETDIATQLDLDPAKTQRLALFSGSVSSEPAAQGFWEAFHPRIEFHSFVESDQEILRRFCHYIEQEQPGFKRELVAIISEDETAYGRSDGDGCLESALSLYYPRDISALRGAYQTTSLFNTGTSAQPADTERRNLPSDLADPAGKVHDSIRSYGATQTPLNQEAFLLEIVAALQELHARYIVLRSSNTLDQLFLTSFLRRNYPDGRIVILNSDLMFIRERGNTGLSGVMTLSTYPLFPLERDWTEHQSLPASDRAFSANSTEGAYVALRLLLNDASLNGGTASRNQCHVVEDGDKSNPTTIFVPKISCTNAPPIPDYSPPFWTLSNPCGEKAAEGSTHPVPPGDDCVYPGPASWLSVIGVNRNWPMASLLHDTPEAPPTDTAGFRRAKDRAQDPLGRPVMPLAMKIGWLLLVGFSLFHWWCCRSGSYTAKPAFRAHFASTGEGRHAVLVCGGSCLVGFLAIVAGWGCGVFAWPPPGLAYSWSALAGTIVVSAVALLAIHANNHRCRELSKDQSSGHPTAGMSEQEFIRWDIAAVASFVVAMFLFWLILVVPFEGQLMPENRVLTYWRAMHLTSGVSPVVPILLILVGLYLSFWFALHGLALFGRDRPRLPLHSALGISTQAGKGEAQFLPMFSEEGAGTPIEEAAKPLSAEVLDASAKFLVGALAIAWGVSWGTPIRSLGSQWYAIVFLFFLIVCCTLALAEAWRLYRVWDKLRRLLEFLDKLPSRRAIAALRGFSWENVWAMSGNVLEVRYKVISRQIECMHHTISSLEDYKSRTLNAVGADASLAALTRMQTAATEFAKWYSENYAKAKVGDLTNFTKFQEEVAQASGTLFSKLLVPAWREEGDSLLAPVDTPAKDNKGEGTPSAPLLPAKEEHIRNAEEFVCLNYLAFVQNILGRLRTMAMTIVVIFLAATIATSTYPFDPRQGLTAVLIALFVIAGIVIVKVYAEMHRDATLSHVTNTTPGELGTEFWFKIIGFGFAPLVTLLTRVFPGITDFVFSWLQPGVASLK
jgi:hypothetical protein